MTTFVENQWLESHTCGQCGMLFAAPATFWAERKNDRATWYCPAGHPRVFSGPSEAAKLRTQLEREQQVRQAAEARAASAEAERKRVTKAHHKMRTRVMNGVCPCCNRSFENLRRHMQTQHADFGKPKTLAALRQAFGMTQADVAAEAGVSAPYVSLYEHERPLPQRAATRLEQWIEQHSGLEPT